MVTMFPNHWCEISCIIVMVLFMTAPNVSYSILWDAIRFSEKTMQAALSMAE